MSLLLWLPLNGDTRNQGLTNATVGNTGATVSNSGKTGSCYVFNGTSSYFQVNGLDINSKPCLSICFWVVSNSGDLYGSFIIRKSGNHQLTLNTTGLNFRDSKHSSLTSITFTQPTTGVWTHYAIVYDNGSWIIYKDGTEVKRQTYAAATLNSGLNEIRIGRAESSSENKYFNGSLNDFRIYDHALSQKEVSELSKGLILHYKFDTLNEGNGNLLKEGWGGTTNWTNVSAISTEVPSGLGITHSYVNNTSIEYIPINPDHSYTISFYIKKYKGNGTSGYVYFSIVPYDIDKLQIQNYHSAGLYAPSRTILTQNLVSGDTVIHAQDTSGWKTTGSNYEYCAFFNYSDSTGYLYPPMTYTRNLRTITKANIDNTNNTIPLSAPYTGPTITCGVTICQSTAGSGYYYPYSSSSGAVADWVLKSVTFTPKNTAYIRAAKYVRVLSMSNYQYLAGITFTDNNANTTVYDVAGLGNNGKINNTLSTDQDSPRPGYSLYCGSSTNGYINLTLNTAGFMNSYTFSWWAKTSNFNGKMVWGFQDGNRLNVYPTSNAFCWNTGDGASNPFQNNGTNVNFTPYQDNVWHHYVTCGDGTESRLYIDGEYKGKAKTYKPVTGTKLYLSGWDTSTSYKFPGHVADFRIYGTCLSEDDIKELYNVGGSVDNNGNMYCYEMKEV